MYEESQNLYHRTLNSETWFLNNIRANGTKAYPGLFGPFDWLKANGTKDFKPWSSDSKPIDSSLHGIQ